MRSVVEDPNLFPLFLVTAFSPLVSGRGPNGLSLFIPVLNSHFE